MGPAEGYNWWRVNARPCFHGLAHGAGLRHWIVEPLVFDFLQPGMIVDPDDVVDVLSRAGLATASNRTR
jgi:hypothetical protein